MGKLQTGRFERLSARTYSIKGPGALVDLDETVLGVIQLERQAGMEAHLVQEWETFGTRLHQGAAVGNYAWCLVNNPIGSGRLMVVDGWQHANATNMNTFITRGVPPGFNASAIGEGLDSRIPTGKEPAGRTFIQSTNIGGFGTYILHTTQQVWQDYPIVLAPDGSLAWMADATNQALTISARWAERDAAPFELQ